MNGTSQRGAVGLWETSKQIPDIGAFTRCLIGLARAHARATETPNLATAAKGYFTRSRYFTRGTYFT